MWDLHLASDGGSRANLGDLMTYSSIMLANDAPILHTKHALLSFRKLPGHCNDVSTTENCKSYQLITETIREDLAREPPSSYHSRTPAGFEEERGNLRDIRRGDGGKGRRDVPDEWETPP